MLYKRIDMASLKDKLSLSTDRGQDWKGLLYLAAPVIFAMPDDYERTALITLWFLCMAWVSWITRGNVDPEIAEDINTADEPDFASDRKLADILKEGRR